MAAFEVIIEVQFARYAPRGGCNGAIGANFRRMHKRAACDFNRPRRQAGDRISNFTEHKLWIVAGEQPPIKNDPATIWHRMADLWRALDLRHRQSRFVEICGLSAKSKSVKPAVVRR